MAGAACSRSCEQLRPYVLGWKAYFRLAQTPRVWRELDEWLRHRLRAIQLKQWKRGTTMYRELLALGATPTLRDRWRPTAVAGGATAHAAQHRADHPLLRPARRAPAAHDLNSSNRPVRTRMPGGVAGERPKRSSPMPIVVIPGRREASNPESEDGSGAYAPSRNDVVATSAGPRPRCPG